MNGIDEPMDPRTRSGPASDAPASPFPGSPVDAPAWGAAPAGSPPPSPLRASTELPRKSPVIAAVLSAILPGLGNLYLGYYRMAFLQILVFAGTITLLAAESLPGAEPLLGIFVSFWWFFGVIDAHRRAKLFNYFLLRGENAPELDGDIDLPGSGSLGGGILAVALGILLFLHTRFGLDLRWMAEWWPLAVVGFGIWLIYQARQQKREE